MTATERIDLIRRAQEKRNSVNRKLARAVKALRLQAAADFDSGAWQTVDAIEYADIIPDFREETEE